MVPGTPLSEVSNYPPSLQPLIHQAAAHPGIVAALTLGLPYLIVWLYLFPGTALLRRALWPVGIIALLLNVTVPDEVVQPAWKVTIFNAGAFWNLDTAIRYAFQHPESTFHPLPRRPLLYSLRQTSPFRAFDLIFDLRRINQAPNPPLKTTGRTYLSAVFTRLISSAAIITIHEAIYLIVVRLAPDTFGKPIRHPGDFIPWIQGLSDRSGGIVPWQLIWVGLAWILILGICTIIQGEYDVVAMFFIAIGYSTDEEWPPLMKSVWRSDSLNDLWGTRYHQSLRNTFLLWVSPITPYLPRQFRILAVFTASLALHILLFSPIFQCLNPLPWTIFFGVQAAGCLLERQLFKRFNFRTRGWAGRIWVITSLTLSSLWLAKECYEAGYVGLSRGQWTDNPHQSGTEWILKGLGWARGYISGI